MNLPRPLVIIAAAVAIMLAALVTLAMLQSERNADPPCALHEFEGSRFIVCTYDATSQDMRLVSRNTQGAFMRNFTELQQHLGDDADRVRFAMNAGMFNSVGAPIGLFVAEGRELHVLRLTDGPGNFHMKPNGVFWQSADGAVQIDRSEDYAAASPAARWATQSGPMLVIDGELHPRFAEDGASRLMRNGVGVRDAHTAYFVISSGFVSFGKFARFFRDELECEDALFLDGSVSSLWAPSLDRRDDDHEFGPMVVVLDRD